MKALSYIVASILMLIITVALSGTAYLYMSGIFTAGIQGIEIADSYCSLGEVTFKIKNIGTSAITGLDIEQTNPTDDFLTKQFSGTIEPGKTVNYQDICTGEQSRKCIYRITPPAGKTITSEATCSGRPESLVLSLHFNEEYGIATADSSGKSNNGIFYGETFNDGTLLPTGSGPTISNGKFGKALDFDMVDDYFEAPSSSSLSSLTNELTVEFWIYYRDGNMYGSYINYQDADATGGWDIRTNWDDFRFRLYNGTWTEAFAGAIPQNEWSHWACTYDGENMKIYKNGELVNTTPKTGIVSYPASPVLWIGRNRWVTGRFIDGIIDEVRIFERALIKEEIQAEMQSSMAIIRPIASYSFEDIDVSGYANDNHIWVNGEYGSALSFDGNDDYVFVGTDPILAPTEALTVSAWVKFNSISGQQHFVSRGRDNYGSGYNVYRNGNKIYGEINLDDVDDPPEIDIASTISVTTDVWYHVVLTYDSSTGAKLYVNGNKENSDAQTGSIVYRPGQGDDLTVGVMSFDYPTYFDFNGTIDEVRIYNKALV